MSVTYVNDGDLATPANLNTWLNAAGGKVFDVTSYDATGDGTTDDTSSLQATIDAAEAAGGGIVRLPKGTFLVTASLNIDSNGVTLVGSGPDSIIAAGSLDLAAQVGIINVDGANDITLHSFAITCAGESNGISFHGCSRVCVDDVTITFSASSSNTACIGVYDDGSGSAGTCSKTRITNCTLTPSALAILTQGDPTGPYWIEDVLLSGNFVDGSVADTGTYEGIKIDLHTRFFVITNNVVRGSDRIRVGIHAEEEVYYGIISGNVVDECATSGIRLDNGQTDGNIDSIVIADNVIFDMLGSGKVGVALEGSASSVFRNIKVSSNIIDTVQTGIREASDDSVNLVISGNIIDEPVDIGIYVRSPNTLIQGNHIRATSDVSSGAVAADSTATGCLVTDNHLAASTAGGSVVAGAGAAGLITRNNVGYVTEVNGTATLANGTTSIAVTHGLAKTPDIHDISVTPIEAWGSMTQFWISSPTSTQFTINADQDPGQDVDFAWTASIQ